MAKDKQFLTKQQKMELEQLIQNVTKHAKLVKEEYEENPSDVSGSVTQVHMDSPVLDEDFEYPYNTEFGDGLTKEEMDKIDNDNIDLDRKRWSG
jgi:hypothetical protein|tara:strand:+ start:2846 stop:3127 length:282 start_codon:yes stop_codon:yes gene_type:complete